MSAKSIQYQGVRLVEGTYTQALLTLSGSKQILGIKSQDYAGDADDLLDEIDQITDLLTTITTTQESTKTQIQEDVAQLETIDITDETTLYNQQLATYNELKSQYDAIVSKPIASIISEYSTSTLTSFDITETWTTLVGPISLTEGTYHVIVNFMIYYAADGALPNISLAIASDTGNIETDRRLGSIVGDDWWGRNGRPYLVLNGSFQIGIPIAGEDVNIICRGSDNCGTGNNIINGFNPDIGLESSLSSEYDAVIADPPFISGSSRAIQIVKIADTLL
tara:strand:- start:68 stop:904 length:837 start_codon:yes stop_codon:yes gene_type:complete